MGDCAELGCPHMGTGRAPKCGWWPSTALSRLVAAGACRGEAPCGDSGVAPASPSCRGLPAFPPGSGSLRLLSRGRAHRLWPGPTTHAWKAAWRKTCPHPGWSPLREHSRTFPGTPGSVECGWGSTQALLRGVCSPGRRHAAVTWCSTGPGVQGFRPVWGQGAEPGPVMAPSD